MILIYFDPDIPEEDQREQYLAQLELFGGGTVADQEHDDPEQDD